MRGGGARPAFSCSNISAFTSNGVRGTNGVLEVQYGQYPQQAVSFSDQQCLERLYQLQGLTETGEVYTTDSQKLENYSVRFQPKAHKEYEYNKRRYVRVEANSDFGGNKFTLSNGCSYFDGDAVWVEVQPITWLVDEKTGVLVSKKVLFSGVQFKYERDYDGNFEDTDIKKFLDRCFSKEFNRQFSAYQEVSTSSVRREKNPYQFSFQNVSEEDIIKGAVESGVAVFLHGQSSEGKSARVKELDPTCEIIYLATATPDSLNGKCVYNAESGEVIDVPPAWYKKLTKKCEEEPDQIHVLFFDEMTNALPAIQSMAFNIVLDREVNGVWKLPDNCRIVAAGNDLNDSLAANQLAEPLFNRFAHVYIKTTVPNWLKWATTPVDEYKHLDYQQTNPEFKIHPAIYGFIAFRGEEALRSRFNGETPNADPRKWEMASKVLYRTNNPKMLRALVGDAITEDFCSFCNQQVVTLQDVIDGNYDESDFNMNLSEKYATTVGLSLVEDSHLEKVRDFAQKMGPELQAVFDTLWSRGDDKRYEKLAVLNKKQTISGGRTK